MVLRAGSTTATPSLETLESNTTETLMKKTRVGHKASGTRTVRQMEIVASEQPDKARLALLQLTLKERSETTKNLDAEIVNLIHDEPALTEEIEQADSYKETIFSALTKADKLLKDPPTTPPIHVTTTPTTMMATGYSSST